MVEIGIAGHGGYDVAIFIGGLGSDDFVSYVKRNVHFISAVTSISAESFDWPVDFTDSAIFIKTRLYLMNF
jgi:hypothetical protein